MRFVVGPLSKPLPAQGPGNTGSVALPRPSRVPSRRALAVIASAICTALLAVQLVSGWNILHSSGIYSAEAAHHYVWLNAAAVVLIALVAAFAPAGWRWLAIGGPLAVLCVVLIATAIPGGQAVAMLSSVLIMAAAWDLGERLLRRLGADRLAELALVAWLAGIAVLSLGTILLGRLSVLRWWTGGIVVIGVGSVGCARLLKRLHARRESLLQEIGSSSLSLACVGIILLICAWAAIFTAAPEIQFDALYGKAYLPELWAQTGHIGSIPQHVQLEIAGWFQVLAVYGHLLGGAAVGRYMQLLGLGLAAAAVWWWGRRYGQLGPLTAVAVVVTPHLFWQATTADDDLLLALGAFAMCAAMVESLELGHDRDVRGIAFALGLLAGAGPSLKLHLIPLFAMLLLVWIAAGRTTRTVTTRLIFAGLGAAITSLPPLILRWISTGNPVLPAYNNIFHSKYWLPVNEKANFPFWPHAGTFGPVEVIWKSALDPNLMAEIAPPGAFGIFVGAVLFAVLFGWYGSRRSRANFLVWTALLLAIAYWWVNLRYLRYLLPIGFVSVALTLMVLKGVSLSKHAQQVSVLAAALAAVASFPITIGQFWNVPTRKPPIYAAIGRWKASSYEELALPARSAMLAFNRLSPRGSRVATTAFERELLTGGRELYALSYEVIPRLELHGPLPTTADETLVDLSAVGISWLLVTEASRLQSQGDYISKVLTRHGQIEFAGSGWDLYKLVSDPPRPVPFAACDLGSAGVPSCWSGPRTADGSLISSATRTVAVCAGQMLVVSLTQAGGALSPVLIQFNGSNSHEDTQPGDSLGGTTQRIYATVPAGATSASVTASPIGGAQITSASIGRFGPACRVTHGPGVAR